MLETVRDFAAGQLDEHDRDQLGLSHATYYSTIAARIGELRFDDHETSVRLGDQELGNLRAAMTWAFTNLHARLGMSIASDLWRYFWEQASGGNENVRWGRTALELIDEDDDDVLLVAAGTVIEAYNLGDRDAEAYAAKRVRRGLGVVNDPVVKSRLLVALGTSVMDTDPRAAEAFLDEAWTTAPLRPRSIDILNNHIELSWLVGTLDGATIHERLDEVLRLLSEPPPTAVKIEAGAAACAGHWDEVMRLTETATGFDKSLTDLHLLRSEALGALDRYDDALALAGQPYEDDYQTDIQRAHLVCAHDRSRPRGPRCSVRAAHHARRHDHPRRTTARARDARRVAPRRHRQRPRTARDRSDPVRLRRCRTGSPRHHAATVSPATRRASAARHVVQRSARTLRRTRGPGSEHRMARPPDRRRGRPPRTPVVVQTPTTGANRAQTGCRLPANRCHRESVMSAGANRAPAHHKGE